MNYDERLAELLLLGDESGVLDYLKDEYGPLDRHSLYNKLLTPAMYEVGKRWESNQISVADEHLATAICDFVLSYYDNHLETNPLAIERKKALLFGIEGEQHYLGLKMVASVFRDQGWSVRNLGADLPLEHALHQIKTYKPAVIGLSAALSYRLPKLKEAVAVLRTLEWQPQVVVGGRMAHEHDLKRLLHGQAYIVKDLDELAEWLKGIQVSSDATSL
ncbi:hypothetical protein N781_13220 [Pontibacillus halophilus JSM 076056 = DSM 19796]|uniref:B12-binding domain-containing protein n=1 Tax=Pontibacillus halophilus JSM 076056 = DSM 19796 TaxID=1385510 RepID=A0A0A5GHX0_9BACI|nr:cobalamin B12-binding domain-containing protein [Pontibacillus halophilus]KGX92851.1 hypothetical protein N781_13220 [Pontibacillus halophilus JSM 076056 = DSM 19796]